MVQKNKVVYWKFNPCTRRSHHGGDWVRIDRPIHKAINSFLKEQIFDMKRYLQVGDILLILDSNKFPAD